MNGLKELALSLRCVSVFRSLLEDEVIASLLKLLECEGEPLGERLSRYGEFLHRLYMHGDDLSLYILNIVTDDENIFIKKAAHGEIISDELEQAVRHELELFGALSSLTREDLRDAVGYGGFLPAWRTRSLDIAAEYYKRRSAVEKYGYGIYAKYHMFCVKDGAVIPVKHPDPISLSELSGYEKQRQAVIDNTLALLEGRPAANVLLSGDAGTGKSSTVKAVANKFRSEGLRIIELRKDQLTDIPAIVDELSINPLKFILFIDDLSFNKADDNFSALKAILEGSVSAKSENVAIYATSNRRHMVKESFSDRDSGDDIHRNDTVQELLSLSERFGLCVTFYKPSKECYLDIVSSIAEKNGVEATREMLDEAERFALIKGGRSARVAKHFVDSILSSKQERNASK